MMKYLMIFVAVFCFVSDLCAESRDLEQKGWKSSISAGFNLTDGNSDTTLLNFGIQSEGNLEGGILRFEGKHSFGEDGDKTNVDTSEALAEYKYLLGKRLYVSLGNNFFRDETADIKYRDYTNFALGYFFVKNPVARFSLEAGPSYVFEEVEGETDDYLASRVGERFEYQLSKTSSVFQDAEFLVQVDDTDNYQINAEAGVKAAVTETLSLVLSVTDRYDNMPATDKERNDVAMTSALAYNF